jgi:integrase
VQKKKAVHVNLTSKHIESLRHANKRVVVNDAHVDGLSVRVEPLPSGRKTFVWLRKINGKKQFRRIGEFPALSVEAARDKAGEYNTLFAKWKASDFEGDSPLQAPRRDLTFSAVLEDYCERHLAVTAKNPEKACWKARWQLKKYFPLWLDTRIGTVHKKDVLDLHTCFAKTHSMMTANRNVQLLRAMYNWAIGHMAWKGENPAKIKLYSEKKFQRMRYLNETDDAELVRLFAALRDEPGRDLQHFVVMALFTGVRMSDVLSARWENIKLDPPAWTIPNPKSTIPYVVPLMPEVVDILKERRASSPWVFPGVGKTGHIVDLKRSWARLLKRAKIVNFRKHDMRRTLASWQANAGVSLAVIGKGLGHQSEQATRVYARLGISPVNSAITAATRAMLAASQPKKTRKTN